MTPNPLRRFEVVRGDEVIGHGVEFSTPHSRPVVVVDTAAEAPMPTVYGAARHVEMAYAGSSLRWIDEEG